VEDLCGSDVGDQRGGQTACVKGTLSPRVVGAYKRNTEQREISLRCTCKSWRERAPFPNEERHEHAHGGINDKAKLAQGMKYQEKMKRKKKTQSGP
jgi:hypothetical protein